MTDFDQASLFAAWLEGSLTPAQRHEFERMCLDDDVFARQVENAAQWLNAGDSFTAPAIPLWDKSATFTKPQQVRWYQWQGIPMASMAMSVLAIVMVVSGFRVDMTENRLSLGFSDNLGKQDVTALVEARVEDYRSANQATFREYADALASQQRQSSAELTTYLLASSRKERREDFAELVKFINQQRTDDQRFYARQLHNLQQEVSALENTQTKSPLTSFPDATSDD